MIHLLVFPTYATEYSLWKGPAQALELLQFCIKYVCNESIIIYFNYHETYYIKFIKNGFVAWVMF